MALLFVRLLVVATAFLWCLLVAVSAHHHGISDEPTPPAYGLGDGSPVDPTQGHERLPRNIGQSMAETETPGEDELKPMAARNRRWAGNKSQSSNYLPANCGRFPLFPGPDAPSRGNCSSKKGPATRDGYVLAGGDCPEVGDPRIINGIDSTRGEWPFVVRLTNCIKPKYCVTCTGSLISARWILTSAHCVNES